MALIPQQEIILISGLYNVKGNQIGAVEREASKKLRETLDSYPPCRIVSISANGKDQNFTLTAVIETI